MRKLRRLEFIQCFNASLRTYYTDEYKVTDDLIGFIGDNADDATQRTKEYNNTIFSSSSDIFRLNKCSKYTHLKESINIKSANSDFKLFI